jgi:Tfp pilus assembly PilM family ATPase
MFNIFNKVDKRSVGIDIGESSVKLVDIVLDNDKLVLNNYTELQLGKYVGKEAGDIVKLGHEDLKHAMSDLYEISKSDCRNITVGIPMSACQFKLITFSKKVKPFLNDLVELEFRKYTLVPVSELSISFNILKEDENNLHVLVVAIKNKEIERINYATSFIKKDNYKLEPSMFGLIRNIADKNHSISMVVDFGASTTSVLYIIEGSVYGVDTFAKGINEIVINIKTGLSLDYVNAHNKFFSLDILDDTKMETEIAARTMHHICEEVIHIQNNFSRKFNVKCSTLYISGGGSKINNILKFLEKEFKGMEVLKINSFERLYIPESVKDIALKNSPTYNNAIGLALSDIINF